MSNVIRWNPFREIAEMQRQLDRVFDDTWSNFEPRLSGNWLALDVTETEGEYKVVADMPGLTADDIHINLHDGVLNISGEVKREETKEEDRIVLQERVYGKFSRSVQLPLPVNADKVNASYDNGILTLTLPKAESAKPRQIQVKTPKLLSKKS